MRGAVNKLIVEFPYSESAWCTHRHDFGMIFCESVNFNAILIEAVNYYFYPWRWEEHIHCHYFPFKCF